MKFVAIDVETANPNMASICQVGLVRFEDGVEVASDSILIDPKTWFDPYNVDIHGIGEDRVRGAPTFPEVYGRLAGWTAGEIVVCHTHFDRVATAQACAAAALNPLSNTWLDTAKVSRRHWPEFSARGYGLANVASHCGITFQHHDALHDARAAGLILIRAITESGQSIADWIARTARGIASRQDVTRQGDGDGALVGEVVVFTGALQMPRRDAADRAAEAGGDVAAGVTKHTTMLVVGDQDIAKLHGHAKSTKHRKAEGMMAEGHRIRIVGESDFMALSAIVD